MASQVSQVHDGWAVREGGIFVWPLDGGFVTLVVWYEDKAWHARVNGLHIKQVFKDDADARRAAERLAFEKLRRAWRDINNDGRE